MDVVNNSIYLLQYVSNNLGAREFLAIDHIDKIVIFGDASSCRKIPNIPIRYTGLKTSLYEMFFELKVAKYKIIIESYNLNMKMSSDESIDKNVNILQRRFDEI